jgi:hypothetical protein
MILKKDKWAKLERLKWIWQTNVHEMKLVSSIA